MLKRIVLFLSEGSFDFNYVVKIDGVDPEYYTKPIGMQTDAWKKIEEFKASAKKYYVGAKGRSTLKAVKDWIKESKPKQYFAQWRKDSQFYKEDSVEVYYTRD